MHDTKQIKLLSGAWIDKHMDKLEYTYVLFLTKAFRTDPQSAS